MNKDDIVIAAFIFGIFMTGVAIGHYLIPKEVNVWENRQDCRDKGGEYQLSENGIVRYEWCGFPSTKIVY